MAGQLATPTCPITYQPTAILAPYTHPSLLQPTAVPHVPNHLPLASCHLTTHVQSFGRTTLRTLSSCTEQQHQLRPYITALGGRQARRSLPQGPPRRSCKILLNYDAQGDPDALSASRTAGPSPIPCPSSPCPCPCPSCCPCCPRSCCSFRVSSGRLRLTLWGAGPVDSAGGGSGTRKGGVREGGVRQQQVRSGQGQAAGKRGWESGQDQ